MIDVLAYILKKPGRPDQLLLAEVVDCGLGEFFERNGFELIPLKMVEESLFKAATVDDEDGDPASCHARRHGLAVTSEWKRGFNMAANRLLEMYDHCEGLGDENGALIERVKRLEEEIRSINPNYQYSPDMAAQAPQVHEATLQATMKTNAQMASLIAERKK